MELRVEVADEEMGFEVRERVERRLRFALGRHAMRILSTRVTLHGPGEEDGPSVGARCRVRMRLREGETWRDQNQRN